MDLELLNTTLANHEEPRFRARQIWAWASRGASSYADMTDLPGSLRETLERELPFSSLALEREVRARDGTVKALFRTADGHPLEAVMMRFAPGRRNSQERRGAANAAAGRGGGRVPARTSICVSSQSGCPLTCTFCATGAMRFARNLSASEILDQALYFRRVAELAGERLSHCVFMGMGEPMHNLDNVLAACERLPDLGISHRHTTISTVGWIPGIERLAQQDMPLRLALSLHAAEDALRSQLMPVNDRFPLRDVLDACRAFYARKRRRVFIEYVMLAGVNDRYEQAVALAAALAGGPRARPAAGARGSAAERGSAAARASASERDRSIFKVNLIPYNPTPSAAGYRGSSRDAIAAFRDVLVARGIPTTVRLTRGREIDAACGQLAARH
jgi:23S rRNA (adenine2503-C2)-methyltransferase